MKLPSLVLTFVCLLGCADGKAIFGNGDFSRASHSTLRGFSSHSNGVPFNQHASWTIPDQQFSSDDVISKSTTLALALRGGGCSDSDPTLFFKIGLGSILEAALMLGTIVASVKVSDKYPSIPTVFDLPLLELLASFVIIFASSLFGSIVDGSLSVASNQVLSPNVVPGDPGWYSKLKKPSWNPPGWVFPIMWLIVSKPTQLCAVSRILKFGISKGEDGATKLPLAILGMYVFHLSLGDAWNKVFFGLQCPGRGAAVITLFFGCLITSAYLFFTLDEQAGYYMLPTIGWVAIATALNWNIYRNNK
ncbi:CrtTspO/MBR-related proteinK domain containing protein [Nitzschia inconspicua]|uniref:CrtTspO/MBR-related proteinK domain containing protein n=1 Tax=Nitzschia inconspicua TaxID=303405 RepID=A0A9K3LL99_9STRA|nr:CrtTspO/MBR-related proteinK domain containing protein [Nitzschia inconspicua]KAG7364142.1 CrtTspO/MBR-related proteinK domain containing protein [Nitzschia inconspicua]